MDLHFTPIQPQNSAYLWHFQHWLFGKCNWSEKWGWLKGKSKDLFEDSSIRIGSGILITENETQKTFKVGRVGVLFLKMKQTGFARLQRRLAVQGILFRTDVTVWYVSVSSYVSCVLTFNVHVCIWAFALLESNMQTYDAFLVADNLNDH